ncbi:MAG TPA: hypothetical protein VGM33_24710 [Baekduia sp.]
MPTAAGPAGLAALHALSPAARAAAADDLAGAFATGYWILLGLTALALVPAAFLPRTRATARRSPS